MGIAIALEMLSLQFFKMSLYSVGCCLFHAICLSCLLEVALWITWSFSFPRSTGFILPDFSTETIGV